MVNNMKLFNEIFKYDDGYEIVGLTNELNSFCVYNYYENSDKNVLVLTNSLYDANKFYQNLVSFTDNVLLFPMDDFISSVALAVSPDLKIKRLETLKTLNSGGRYIVVTNLMGILRFLPDYKISDKFEIKFQKGLNINRDKVLQILDNFGYHRESIVTATGEYAVRGFILDIFLIEEIHPIRIEFLGNEIDSIRYFDENTQLSINEITDIMCYPFKEINTSNNSSILDYLNDPFVFMINKSQIDIGYEKLVSDITDYNESNNLNIKHMFELNELKINNCVYLNNFKELDKNTYNFSSNEIECFNSNFDLLEDFVNKKVQDGYTVVFCLSKISEFNKIKEIFPSAYKTTMDKISDNKINLVDFRLNKGFIFNKLCVISEFDIENVKNKVVKYKNTYKIGKKINGFDQLEIGDYVVHYAHGIGKYDGVITLTRNGLKKDYLLILYDGNDKVYIPVEKISSIYKYSSKDGNVPKLNKLSSASWAKTKRSLQKRIHDISKELIELYAQRMKLKGDAYKTDPLEDMFNSDFKYEPTIDQKKSFNDVLRDLESEVPMDRLLCGDVGFGKTEVAFRAMFRTVLNNHQVAYLCPTTVLSRQQYENALERFKNYPVNIALLNRFTTKKETDEIIKKLQTGGIDIVFGTHRLLSDDVKYKNLGLLIVDEEQRFGVTHKEKIKQYKNDVNVLTLSATPIPRTLKMAMSGLRDLSVIDTAPVNRYPVQTYVIQEQELLVKDAIYKELSRNGQVFVLYNRVESILSKRDEICKLVPEARVVVAHGQMSKTELEDVMDAFINHEYDVLLCTTIIETGIDIANANTLIIYDADRFGLSQLYQIRGRVGRSDKIAYAYLMFNKTKMLNDIAIKRLQAIKEFTELGSGYRIAMRDLSLRGAGDILGSDQAGFVDEVGLDLYMKLIDDEIKRLNGEEVEETEDSNKSLIDVETHIADDYVSDEDIKIEIHQLINEIDSDEKLIEIQNQLQDRFGKISDEIKVYMYEELFEKLAEKLHIKRVSQTIKIVDVEIPTEVVEKVKFDKVFMEAYNVCPKIKFRSTLRNVYITLPIGNLEKHFIYYLVDVLKIIYEEYIKNS